MGVTGSWTGVAVFLGLSPMAVAIVLSFFEAEGLLPWELGSCLLFYHLQINQEGDGSGEGRTRTRKKILRRGQKRETTMDGKRRERGR
jgi:hypothetical protein